MWPSLCLRVEVAVLTLASVERQESCLQSRAVVAVVKTGAGVTGRVKGGSGLVAIVRMACHGTTEPVENFRWVWFSMFLILEHWNCLILFS